MTFSAYQYEFSPAQQTSHLVLVRIGRSSLWRAAFLRMEKACQKKTLREREERFRLLVESVKDYAIFMLDPPEDVARGKPEQELKWMASR